MCFWLQKVKGLVLCPLDDNGDDCKYYYCDTCCADSTGSNSDRKFSVTIKITLTVMIVMILTCNYDCGTR
jgi:hypothetical protein